MNERFEFTRGVKILSFVLIGIGLVSLSYGIFSGYSPRRILSNVLIDNFYFLSISLGAIFFVAVQNVANTGWYVCFKRVPEAMASYLPVAGVFMFGVYLGLNKIYPWVGSSDVFGFSGKLLYLKPGFFGIRMAAYFLPWIVLSNLIRKVSIQVDLTGDVKFFKRNVFYSAVFIVVFAITSSTSSWDWLMSIEPGWYSSVFGWYVFSGLFLSGVSAMVILVLFLKWRGYLGSVNANHLHDLGKYVFGLSVLWVYLWYSQFFLIWYGNLPEEVSYFAVRLEHYKYFFYANVFANFVFPFSFLLSRGSKRNGLVLAVSSFIVLIGHWLDIFLMVMPGNFKSGLKPGFFEFGLFIGYLGIFILSFFRALSKVELASSKHPYFKESLSHT